MWLVAFAPRRVHLQFTALQSKVRKRIPLKADETKALEVQCGGAYCNFVNVTLTSLKQSCVADYEFTVDMELRNRGTSREGHKFLVSLGRLMDLRTFDREKERVYQATRATQR
eukprot:gb/GEZN01028472.1/.p1 GENE.gb/GEZN01028472.1/~~gb/GEZN01028472.1/.p1  ORF type:complete len:121 (+),score=10.26 gb/GEZN01028472.1/:27-365(+)